MVDYASLQRELAYYKGLMQSTYGDPNKVGIYREAERQFFNLTKMLETNNAMAYQQPQQYQQPVVYVDPYQQNSYSQQANFSPTYMPQTSSTATGVDMVNTRYSNKSNNTNIQPQPQQQQVVQEPAKPVERKPYRGNEFPFVTDDYTTAEKEDEGDRYIWVFKRLEKPIPNHEKEERLEDRLITLENGLLIANRDEKIFSVKIPIDVIIGKCYVNLNDYPNKIDLKEFKLDTGDVSKYQECVIKPIDSLLTKAYNLTLACSAITISTSSIREDLYDLEKLASTNKIRDLGYAHDNGIKETENILEKRLKVEIEELNSNDVVITSYNSSCVLISTELAIRIKKTNPNGKFVYVNKKSYNSLYDAMVEVGDNGIILYRTNTGGVGYFLYAKSEYNSYCIAI